MKASAFDPVPPMAVVTETVTEPAACSGTFTVSFVAPVTCTVVPGVVPNVTAVTVAKLDPVTVTVSTFVLVAGPLSGVTLVTVGTGM